MTNDPCEPVPADIHILVPIIPHVVCVIGVRDMYLVSNTPHYNTQSLHAHAHTHAHTHAHAHKHTYAHTHMHTHTNTHAHKHTHTNTHTYTYIL